MILSKFGFGTSRLHHISKKKRESILRYALDCGITHFDTAPYYGYGLAEKALSCLSNEKITITTKFGLIPAGGCDQSFIEMCLRKSLGIFLPSVNCIKKDYSLTTAENSLNNSLRRLKRDYVDFLMLHEPEIKLINSEKLRYWLDLQVKKGKILNFGIAGNLECINEICSTELSLAANIQTNKELKYFYKINKNSLNYFFFYHWINNFSLKEIKSQINIIKSNQLNNFRTCYLFSSHNKKNIELYKS